MNITSIEIECLDVFDQHELKDALGENVQIIKPQVKDSTRYGDLGLTVVAVIIATEPLIKVLAAWLAKRIDGPRKYTKITVKKGNDETVTETIELPSNSTGDPDIDTKEILLALMKATGHSIEDDKTR